ncbi:MULTISPECIES: phosphotransferase [unclassified Virgibacillus]|uniref:phosphotransferase n=1 Tax=unclassified Virgibacillus TaxID=2620237 RepID=UPI0024DF0481|nr:phosphotransferase [Virgibacillus sp. LDC-1]
MEAIREALLHYGIAPMEIDQRTSRMFRIFDGNKSYALKKSKLNANSLKNWEHIYHYGYANGLSTILPVYLTKDRSLFVKINGDYYYLSPWIQTRYLRSRPKEVYQAIGKLHSATKQTKPYSKDDSKDNMLQDFRQYAAYCVTSQKKLLSTVEKFEASHFMSPFELQVCTHYRDMERLFFWLQKRIDQYLEEQQERDDYVYSIIHGNLHKDHILQGEQLQFINWEQSRLEHPTIDIATYIQSQTTYYDTDNDELISHFQYYTEENPLAKQDKYLLALYLLHPTSYLQLVEDDVKQRSSESMISRVQKLEKVYRQLLFGIQWNEQLDEELMHQDLEEMES